MMGPMDRSGDVRVSRTDLAANMMAAGTLGRPRSKSRLASMTGAPDPLTNGLANEILTARARGNGQGRLPDLRGHGGRLALGHQRMEGGLGVVLGLGRRMTRTLLATGVLAVDADLVRAESGLAAVAGAADTHADGLGDALDGHVARRLPLARLQSHSIFGKQGAGAFLLDGAPMGQHGGLGGRLAHWLLCGHGGGRGGFGAACKLVWGETAGGRKGKVGHIRRGRLGLGCGGRLLHAGGRRGLGGRASLQDGAHAFDVLGQTVVVTLLGGILLSRHFRGRNLARNSGVAALERRHRSETIIMTIRIYRKDSVGWKVIIVVSYVDQRPI